MESEHRSAIENELISFISEKLSCPRIGITLESQIANLTTDSIQLFELLLAFERAFEMKVSYDDIVRLQTVGDVVELVFLRRYSSS